LRGKHEALKVLWPRLRSNRSHTWKKNRWVGRERLDFFCSQLSIGILIFESEDERRDILEKAVLLEKEFGVEIAVLKAEEILTNLPAAMSRIGQAQSPAATSQVGANGLPGKSRFNALHPPFEDRDEFLDTS
jgi:hypothetical protein